MNTFKQNGNSQYQILTSTVIMKKHFQNLNFTKKDFVKHRPTSKNKLCTLADKNTAQEYILNSCQVGDYIISIYIEYILIYAHKLKAAYFFKKCRIILINK